MKTLSISALGAAILASAPAAASTITVVWTGTVTEGYTSAGEAVTQTYVFDTDAGTSYTSLPGDTNQVDALFGGPAYVDPLLAASPLVSATVEIGASTQSFSGDFLSYLEADNYSLGPISSYQSYAYDTSGAFLYSYMMTNDGSVPTDINAEVDLSGLTSVTYSCIGSYDWSSGTGFTTSALDVCFTLDTLTVTIDVTAPVPLPASALLLTGALAGLGALRRRRRA